MGWTEKHKPANDGAGTTGQIEDAQKALDEMGVPPGPLGVRVVKFLNDLKSTGPVLAGIKAIDDVLEVHENHLYPLDVRNLMRARVNLEGLIQDGYK